ncbi:MAG: GNAT family N-acetyltransferase [Planctomycetota bacterium]|nr:MAG: GNAT family N-acetyltransferase [Planctomycetota bacterium]
MADADIVVIGLDELPGVVDLFNEVFRPPRDQAFLERRLAGKVNPLILLARVERQPVGFALGYELKPSTFYCWLIGVVPDYRRAGIASQLMGALVALAAESGYKLVRFECFNRQRPMLHLAIKQGYNVVGVRYDSDTGDNLLILELDVSDLRH